jgi:hypothetical protein
LMQLNGNSQATACETAMERAVRLHGA